MQARIQYWRDLPIELLSKVASGRDDLKVMRLVCSSWQEGYDDSTTVSELTLEYQDYGGAKLPIPLPLPHARGTFLRLAKVVLRHCRLSEHDLLGLSKAPSLSTLSLSHCHGLTPALVRSLQSLPVLQDLDFFGSDLDDSGLDALRDLPKLTGLGLRWSRRISPGELSRLRGMAITSLKLDNFDENMADTDFQGLRGLPITYLSLKNIIGLTDMCLHEISGMPIVTLDLSTVDVSDAGFAVLAEMVSLRDLTLNYSRVEDLEITSEGFGALRKLALTRLHIGNESGEGSRLMVDDVCLEVLRGMPLTDLGLALCDLMADVGFLHLRNMPLTKLCLDQCPLITGKGLSAVFPGLPLTRLILWMCDGIFSGTDTDLRTLSCLPECLTDLNLGYCTLLSDSCLLPLKGLALQRLNVSGCRLVTDESLCLFLEMACMVLGRDVGA